MKPAAVFPDYHPVKEEQPGLRLTSLPASPATDKSPTAAGAMVIEMEGEGGTGGGGGGRGRGWMLSPVGASRLQSRGVVWTLMVPQIPVGAWPARVMNVLSCWPGLSSVAVKHCRGSAAIPISAAAKQHKTHKQAMTRCCCTSSQNTCRVHLLSKPLKTHQCIRTILDKAGLCVNGPHFPFLHLL